MFDQGQVHMRTYTGNTEEERHEGTRDCDELPMYSALYTTF